MFSALKRAIQLRIPAIVAILLVALLCRSELGINHADAQPSEKGKSGSGDSGLILNTPKASPGYTLIAPLLAKQTILVNMKGEVVHSWESDCTPGQSAYLLENGNLLRPGKLSGKDQRFTNGGDAGRIQEYTWDGELVWDFKLYNDKQLPHHDICRLPNGNILMLVWEKKAADEMIAAGRKKESLPGEFLLLDSIVEVKPSGRKTGKIVWEWRLWDHLIQDHDKTKANYGDVGAHPELVDINFGEDFGGKAGGDHKTPQEGKDDTKKGSDSQPPKDIPGGYASHIGHVPFVPDWTHINSISYNAKFDQILLTSRSLSEVWIIDHSAKTVEAATHEGGRAGKGGDLLYRWGNPKSYRAGKAADQKLFTPHAAHWIPEGLPGEGHVLIFNNAGGRSSRKYSSVDEFALPVDAEGKYPLKPGTAFGPEKLEWSYTAPKKTDLLAEYFSSAQRLPNGNTLICSGVDGIIFEVSPENEVVWKYLNPITGPVDILGKSPPRRDGEGVPPKFGTIFPDDLQAMLKMTPKQKQELADFQKEIFKDIDKLLTEPQKKMFENPKSLGSVSPPTPGQLFTVAIKKRLQLTEEQKRACIRVAKENRREDRKTAY